MARKKGETLWQTAPVAISSGKTRSSCSINCGTGNGLRTSSPRSQAGACSYKEENDQMSITTEIIKYDENLTAVRAITTTMKGNFPGLGMSSVDRDHLPSPQASAR